MIRLENVTKKAASGSEEITILSDVSLEIAEGRFVAVTGASGSGKSTMLGLIAGLDEVSAGKIFIDDDEITAMSEDALADLRSRKVGFIFQSFHLIPSLTALENIMIPMEILGRGDAKSRGEELLSEVGLRDRGHHYPSELSGGEQQRVAIARAFANEPLILLADEPTGNLDSKNGRHILDLMLDLHKKHRMTLLLVTHDESIAATAERQIVLSDGRILSDSQA